MQFFNKSGDTFVIKMIILAMMVGFVSGITGQIVSDVYLYPWRQNYILDGINNPSNTPSIPELRRIQTFLGIDQDFEIDKSIDKVSPALVGVYPVKASSGNVTNQLFLPTDLISSGFVLTEDGWVISYLNGYSGNFVVSYDNQVYTPDKVIIDKVTGVAFIKIPVTNLPVVVLGDSDNAALGQLEIILNSLDQVAVVNLKSLSYLPVDSSSDYVLSSEEYGELFLVSDGITDLYLGSPLINLGGEIIGIVSSIDSELGLAWVVPINQFRSVVLDVLRSESISRTYLGIEYIDLSKTIGINKELTQGLNRGALVYQDPVGSAPAYISQLQRNDIILSVDGQLVDEIHNLTDLIQQYQVGDEVTLEVLRGQDTISKNVVLGALPE